MREYSRRITLTKVTLLSEILSKEELDKACWPVYQKLMDELGDRYPNWIVVIEPTTGTYFLGQDDQEVLSRARQKHPRAQFFAYRLSEDPALDMI